MAATNQGAMIMVYALAIFVGGIIYFVLNISSSSSRSNYSGGSFNKMMKAGKRYRKHKT
jgi:hypothetical protein